jgi:hypothetical protein
MITIHNSIDLWFSRHYEWVFGCETTPVPCPCPTDSREVAITALREAGWAEPERAADLIAYPGEEGAEHYHFCCMFGGT